MNIFLSHVNVHQRVTPAEEDFKNHMEKMTHSVDTSQPLPSHLSLLNEL